jgi:hypothetical protein
MLRARGNQSTPNLLASKQPGDAAVGAEVDGVCRRHPRQAGHGHDLSADRHDELRSGREPHLAHGDDVIRRRALEVRIGRETVLSLGDADREIAEAHLLSAGPSLQ